MPTIARPNRTVTVYIENIENGALTDIDTTHVVILYRPRGSSTDTALTATRTDVGTYEAEFPDEPGAQLLFTAGSSDADDLVDPGEAQLTIPAPRT